MAESTLRQRTPKDAIVAQDTEPVKPKREQEVVWGKTPTGEVFRVPTTYDVLTALFHPSHPKSHFDTINLLLLALQVILFLLLPKSTAQVFFLAYFAFWRAAYDGGLGWVLGRQSKRRWMVREVQRRGWLDKERRPKVREWVRRQLEGKMGGDYDFDELPLEYNTWLLFRQVVDVILINDFLAYCLFAFSHFRVPEGLSLGVHIMRWLAGTLLILFNLWVKTEAHHIVKDYGWYWGDVFFQRGALVFDGVFELAPHPMYSVGYAGYYGLSLISGSYPVLFGSIAAHAAQFAFLVFFENPHIERLYGQRKPIARRTPLFPRSSTRPELIEASSLGLSNPLTQFQNNTDAVGTSSVASTPSVTEGETATETETETETEIELDAEVQVGLTKNKKSLPTSSSSYSGGNRNVGGSGGAKGHQQVVASQHDLLNRYFRRDSIILRNVDVFRAPDFMFLLIITYAITLTVLPSFLPSPTSPSSSSTLTALHYTHALLWCIFHSFGLGWVLRLQSRDKWLVRHFMKNYHYDGRTGGGDGARIEAFGNWKVVFNLSMCMSYVSFLGLVYRTYSIPNEWAVGDELLRHTLGVALIALDIWATRESYEVLGVFGWFFGDFFMEEFPSHLEYTGIFRYLNNPDLMGGAAWYGLALISGNKSVLSLAVIRQLSHWWFLSYVESPHMRKLYGDSLRKEAGFVKVIKSVASKNASRIMQTRAGRQRVPELTRVAKEVKGTFDKVYEETADAVEEFLAKSRPKIEEVVQDTKVLLQQSRERLVITRIANDLSSYDTTKYQLRIVSSSPSDEAIRFHLGEPISVKWQAPHEHSRRDWIGIYRVGANKSNLVTKTSSLGMWTPVHDEEWDGDVPLGLARPTTSAKSEVETGIVVFKGNTLPWQVGRYEIRYHHDGKYNVMSSSGPMEVYVDKPSVLTFDTVREALMRVVPLCLDSDPSLIPLSCKRLDAEPHEEAAVSSQDQEGRDPDDFSFWSERQAKRICAAVKQTFDVEYAPEVVVADANLSALANRILLSKEILTA